MGKPPTSGSRPPAADGGNDDVLWLRGGTQRPPRRAAPLTRERIVAAAVAELDAHGAERLTMRRLAERLDVTSTALYWHVSTKEDLLDLAVDHVVGEVPIPETDGATASDPGPEPGPDSEPDPGPRAAIRALLLGWRAAMLAHPWSPGLMGRPLLGPNVLARIEFLQAMLTRTGLSGIDLASATRLLSGFVIGAGMADTTWRRLDNPAVLAKARAHITGLRELYPTLSTSGFVDGAWSDDELFHLGLNRVLDTLAPAQGPETAGENH